MEEVLTNNKSQELLGAWILDRQSKPMTKYQKFLVYEDKMSENPNWTPGIFRDTISFTEEEMKELEKLILCHTM